MGKPTRLDTIWCSSASAFCVCWNAVAIGGRHSVSVKRSAGHSSWPGDPTAMRRCRPSPALAGSALLAKGGIMNMYGVL